MTHDPLCPTLLCNHNDKGECWWGDFECPNPCRCDLIAKVRQDQRIISLSTRVRELKPYANGYCDGERDMLAKCIALCDSHITRINNEAASQDYERFANEFYANADGIEFIAAAMRALQEMP